MLPVTRSSTTLAYLLYFLTSPLSHTLVTMIRCLRTKGILQLLPTSVAMRAVWQDQYWSCLCSLLLLCSSSGLLCLLHFFVWKVNPAPKALYTQTPLLGVWSIERTLGSLGLLLSRTRSLICLRIRKVSPFGLQNGVWFVLYIDEC